MGMTPWVIQVVVEMTPLSGTGVVGMPPPGWYRGGRDNPLGGTGGGRDDLLGGTRGGRDDLLGGTGVVVAL